MRISRSLAILLCLNLFACPVTVAQEGCIPDGKTFWDWKVQFSGYGCVVATQNGSEIQVRETPKTSTSPDETHAAMVTGRAFKAPYYFRAESTTVTQLRRQSPPNAWEAGWWMFDYADRPISAGGPGSFYYFILKPNGWELGKRDSNYPGEQRFLTTGKHPQLTLGVLATIEIESYNLPGSKDTHICVYTEDSYGNRRLLTQYNDTERPYSGGNIGLYDEDSDVIWTHMSAGNLNRKPDC